MLDRNVSNENIEVEAEYIAEATQPAARIVEVAQASSQDPAFVDPATGAAIGVPSNGQSNPAATRFVADASNTITLPVGVSLDNIEIDGNDIILVQADGTRIVIEGGALNVPTFLIGAVEVPQQVLVAALQANGINVAAGPDGAVSVVSNSGSAGGNFAEGSGDIGEAGDAISLLSDTDQADDNDGGEDEQPVDQNDAPEILTASDGGAGSVTEAVDLSEDEIGDADHTATGTIGFTDADLGDVHTVTVVAAGEGYLGNFTAVVTDSATFDGQGTVTWTFTVADNAIDFLAAGETRTQSYVVTIADRNGLPVQQTITVNIIGTNDAPVLDAGNVEGVWSDVSENEEGMIIDLPSEAVKIAVEGETSGDEPASEELPATHSVEGVLNFTDVDLIDTHVVSVSDRSEQQERTYVGQLEAVLTQDTTGGAVGEISWTFTADDAELDFLTEGQQISQTYIVTVTDSAGATSQQTITVRIYGSNDTPVIESAVSEGSVTEIADGAKGENVDVLEATGTIAFSDVDTIDKHSVTTEAQGEDYLGTFEAVISDSATGDNEGEVTWTFKVADAAIDYLAAGETLTQTYTVIVSDGKGGTVAQDVTVTITGTNDVPVLGKGSTEATVTEFVDGRGRDETPRGFDKGGDERHGGDWGAPAKAHSATGVINFSDADDTNTHTVTAAAKGEAYLGEFIPSISNAATGDNAGQITWKFTVDDKDIDFLGAGDTLVQTYTVSLVDSSGATVTQDVTITLVGTNDRAEITANWWAGDDWGVVVEDGKWNSEKTASGDLDIKDVDQGEAVFQTPESLEGKYGTFTFNAATGQWSYVINNKLAATQALNGWKVAEDTLTVYSKDGTDSHTITVYVNGTNDVAVISGESAGTITEDVKMTTGGTLTVSDVDTGEAVFDAPSAKDLVGKYGAFAFNAKTGEWTYQAATDKVQKLAAGETVTETLTVKSKDGTDSQTITVTITGTNDKPVFVSGGETSTTLTEGKFESGDEGHGHGHGYGRPPVVSTELKASGEIDFTDVDASDKHTVSVASNETYLGTFSANVSNDSTNDGKGTVSWSFKVDDSKVNYLAAGQTLVQTYTITLDDKNGGTVSQIVTVKIVGTNDAPVILSGSTDAVGAVTEDASKPVLTDTGVITFKDVDLIDTHTLDVSGSKSNSLGGKLTVTGVTEDSATENGSFTWTYKVDNAKVQYLGAGDTATETFTVTISDGKGGSITQDITVTVTGTNDAATISADWWDGGDFGYVKEDGIYNSEKIASGDLDITDVDQGEAVFKQPSADDLDGTYGTFQFNKQTGEWYYTIDNARAETQALNGGTEVYDTLTVWSADGTDSHTVYVLVSGTNDNAVISGKADGIVVEDGVQTAGGTLSVKDVDAGEAKFQSVSDWALAGTYGKFTFNATTGEWTYKVDNSKVQALGAGDTVTDSLTVRSFDGTDSQVIKVTINGTNDPAEITGTKTGAVVEDGVSYASGDLDIKDVDDGEAKFVKIEGNALNGTYGKFTFNQNSGKWEYRLDNTLAATQALKAGQAVIETLTVKAVDGTTALVKVTVTGTNDGASISGSKGGSVTEDGGQTAEGTLTVSDKDTGENQLAAPASLAGKYGSFTLDTATGAWKYTLDNANADVQGLAGGKSLTDTLAVKSVDGTASETISVTINGTNDAAVIGTPTNAAVTEDVGVVSGNLVATGSISISDVDAGQNSFKTSVTSANGNVGSLVLQSNGSYTYTVSNAAVQSLGAGTTKVDSFTVTALDGTTKVVEFTVNGANDAAVIGTPTNAAVTEDVSVVSGNLVATGSISISDVDAGQNSFKTSVTSANGNVGSLVLQSNGSYTYTVSNAAVQSLGAGTTKVDSFTVTALDGTTKVVEFTVNGANDAAVIGTPTNAAVTEDVSVVSGNLVATGSISISDVDAGQNSFKTSVTSANGNVGSLVLQSNGSYTYTVSNAAVQSLGAGTTKVDSFTVTALDGTTKVVEFTVNGAAEATPVTVNESTSATGRYAFVDNNDSPSSINFDASKLFSGVTSDTKYSYLVVSATDTPWLSTEGKMIEGDPRSNYWSGWSYDSNGDTGLYVYQVTATTNGVTQTTYVAFSAIESAGTTFNIQNNGNWNNSGSLDYANDRNGDGDVINIVSSGIKDQVQAGAGDDVVVGYSDDNNIDGGSGDDAIYGMGGDDFLDGWTGNDFLDGGAGDDTLYGYDGNDVLLGGAGNDFLSGESGNDILVGGSGNDDLSGGTGIDYLTGGAGSDTFILSDLNAVDVITDFNASEDMIDLTALLDGISKTTDLETSGYVKAVQSGSDTLLQVDTNGGGNSWTTVAVLQNYTHTNEAIRILFDDSTHKPVEQQV
ncbi:VCBS domain-containing protein [Rhizobium sp. SL42]|uniref:VCBS domain-containing protein n=1 Tax=Rhizobium sp. SL42 TaxID=2806346 RepID=UPI001F243547|nr:VCBS domain-containing protein [Rhizobium sp. SL42]UJW77423.1 hypothetical protein IM739_20370 [Rhizobium sp. SL42]